MNPFHVNRGLLFEHPYESRYARLRRCVLVNPGISYGPLKSALLAEYPGYLNSSVGLRDIPGWWRVPYWNGQQLAAHTYQRQCPECAARLYHTDVYALPWLRKCPIHHEALTENCPKCGQPWPGTDEVPKRDCPTCGRAPLSAFHETMKLADLSAIEQVYRFAEDLSSDYELWDGLTHLRDEPAYTWWEKITLVSPLFAAVQAQRHPEWSAAELAGLGVSCPPVRCRQAQLQLIHSSELPESYEHVASSLDMAPTLTRYKDAEFDTLRTIVSWIDRQTSEHTCHISNYRNLNTSHFLRAPAPPCPYCMALSLWYFQTQYKWIAYRRAFDRLRYPFMKQGHFYQFFDACEPFIGNANLTVEELQGLKPPFTYHYATDVDFARWFYSRGLQLSFMAILHASLDWLNRLQHLRSGNDLRTYRGAAPDKLIQETLYLAPRDSEGLTFYYLHDAPIEHYEAGRSLQYSSAQCDEYQRFLSLSDDATENFDFPIVSSTFNQILFNELEGSFKSFFDVEISSEFRLDVGDALLHL